MLGRINTALEQLLVIMKLSVKVGVVIRQRFTYRLMLVVCLWLLRLLVVMLMIALQLLSTAPFIPPSNS